LYIRKYQIFLILVILTTNLFSLSKIDSLETILDNLNGHEKINALNRLSNLYRIDNSEISYDYATQALELAKTSNDQKGIADALNGVGHYFRKIHEFEEAINNFQQALEIYRKLKSNSDIANIYNNIGHIYWFQGYFSKSLDYYKRSLGISIALGDEHSQSISYNNLGTVYYRLGMYDDSMKNFLKSLSIREEINDPLLHSTLNNLGNIYVRLSDHSKALEMYQLSLEHKRKLQINTESTLNNIGNIYLKLKDYDSALKYLSEALKINEENKNEKEIASSLNNIAIVYEELGKTDEALNNYQKALTLKKKVKDLFGYANTAKNLGDIFLKKEDYKQANLYLSESLEIAKKIRARDIIKDIYELKSQYYYQKADYENAYLYKKNCSCMKDSLFNEETGDKITQYRNNFTIEKTLKEKELLLKDNQIYKLQVEKDKSWRFSLFLMVLLLVSIGIFLIHNIMKRNKLNAILGKVNEDLENRIDQRTAEILETNENLKNEIEVRKETADKLKSSLDEKDVMLKEIHHRVKNNLQVLTSILNIQARASTNEETIKMLKNTHSRIMSMSLVQEQLYSNNDLAVVDFKLYVKLLVNNIYTAYRVRESRIRPIINIQDIELNVNTAIPCGLLINEIVVNAVKHGFNDNKKGEIKINMSKDENEFIHLEISNTGAVLPDNIDYKKPETTGLELIRIIIIQLSAEVEVIQKNGVLYKLKFKKLKN